MRTWVCISAWAAATALFVLTVMAWGGPGLVDFNSSGVATLAIAHGEPSCAYAPSNPTPIPPLYPLLTGAVVAVTHLGGSSGFPSTHAHESCAQVATQIYWWSSRHFAFHTVGWTGVVGWLALLAGFLALLRALGRGRSLWEVVGVMMLALLPAGVDNLVEAFHPNDLMAAGLLFGSVAAALKNRWLSAGVLMGLGIGAHQYALLVALPLMILVPRRRRLRFVGGGALSLAVVVLPMDWLTHGAALRSLSGGATANIASSGTWLAEMHLHGALQFGVSRIVPLILAVALGVWLKGRLDGALTADAVLVMLTVGFALRLLFEINLWAYYLLPLCAVVVIVDCYFGKVRYATVLLLLYSGLLYPAEFSRVTLPGHLALYIWSSRFAIVPLLLVVAMVPVLRWSPTSRRVAALA